MNNHDPVVATGTNADDSVSHWREIPSEILRLIDVAATYELQEYFSDSRAAGLELGRYEVRYIVGGILQRAKNLYQALGQT